MICHGLQYFINFAVNCDEIVHSLLHLLPDCLHSLYTGVVVMYGELETAYFLVLLQDCTVPDCCYRIRTWAC